MTLNTWIFFNLCTRVRQGGDGHSLVFVLSVFRRALLGPRPRREGFLNGRV